MSRHVLSRQTKWNAQVLAIGPCSWPQRSRFPATGLVWVSERDILCLASGGAQQGSILAAAGARVTVFDASPKQLAQDAMVAEQVGLVQTTGLGFMHDLSCFTEASFDLIFHPASNCFAPDIIPVWSECFRVRGPDEVLLARFMNPDVYIFDKAAEERGAFVVRFPLPYADMTDMPPEELCRLVEQDHVVEFSY